MVLGILHLLAMFVADTFKPRRRLEAENLFLRHQLNIALRRAPPRLRLHGSDRALLVWITRIWPDLLDLSQVVKPETTVPSENVIRTSVCTQVSREAFAHVCFGAVGWVEATKTARVALHLPHRFRPRNGRHKLR
jgi:hypothetical protein